MRRQPELKLPLGSCGCGEVCGEGKSETGSRYPCDAKKWDGLDIIAVIDGIDGLTVILL